MLKKYCNYLILLLNIIFFGIFEPAFASDKANALTVYFNPGSVMQLIAPKTEAETRPLRDKYFEKSAQTAREYGYAQNGVLVVEKTLMGTFSPNVFVISQWPSLKAQKSFQALPLYSDIKSLRKEAWVALKLYDHETTKPTTLTFFEDKLYTVSLAWVNPVAPDGYYQYLEYLSDSLENAGGKIISKTNDITLSDHNPHAVAPQQIVITEWEDTARFEQFFSSSENSEKIKVLQDGTVNFELHLVRPRV